MAQLAVRRGSDRVYVALVARAPAVHAPETALDAGALTGDWMAGGVLHAVHETAVAWQTT